MLDYLVDVYNYIVNFRVHLDACKVTFTFVMFSVNKDPLSPNLTCTSHEHSETSDSAMLQWLEKPAWEA